jgi:DNA polymerase-3 subunit delta'
MSNGNYREALNLLQHADEDFHGLLKDWLNAAIKNNPVTLVKLIEDIARLGREKQKQFLRNFTHQLEQAVRLQTARPMLKEAVLNALTDNEKGFVERLNRVMTLEQKEAIASELDKAAYHTERNANAKILFHAMSIRIHHIVKNNIVLA